MDQYFSLAALAAPVAAKSLENPWPPSSAEVESSYHHGTDSAIHEKQRCSM
jgi:hypothetical protein